MIPKFRAWHNELGRMMLVKAMLFFANELEELELNDSIMNDNIPVYPDEIKLMQSTGLFDKNGKEIFEGDIVKRYGIKRPEVVRFGEWIDVDTLGFKEQYIGFYFESEHEGQKRLYSVESRFNNLCKVIGNIYENPELLEVTE